MCNVDLTYGMEGWAEIVPIQGNGKVGVVKHLNVNISFSSV